MLIRHLLLQYPLTTESSKLPCSRCQNHRLCYSTMSRSLLASLHWLHIRQRVTFKLAGLVYRSLHETSPTYLSSVLHAYTPARSLRSSSAHLLVEPRLRTTLASRGSQLTEPSSDLSLLTADALWCEISAARIWTHELWIRKRVCYLLHHDAPQSRPKR